MKVIILQDTVDLGKKYEIKEVKNGYAQNFLIPQGLVKPATKENLGWLENQKKTQTVKAEDELKKIQGLASNIDGLEIIINVKVGEDGQLFESINSQKISEKLKELGFNIKKSQILLENPIKELGEFPIKITLEHNLEAEIALVVNQEKAS
ncbi:50S ribosomal protein L9 [Patescibacteria group bacterium]|nr:50S ribosomal protein L9 [Patescibacteria group bacterium]